MDKIFIPLLVGTIVIFQGVTNKAIGNNIGLGKAVLINAFITLILATALQYFISNYPGSFPKIFVSKTPGSLDFKWWYIIPGICGLLIILGFPFAIYHLGAAKATILIIAAQVIVSTLWDIYVGKVPITTYKAIAAALALGSVLLANIGR